MKRIAIVLLALSCLTAPVIAAEMVGEGAAKPADAPLIAPESFAPAMLLPAPTADGTGPTQAEIKELRAIGKSSTAGEFAEAMWDDEHENAAAFNQVMGVDLTTLPETAKLLEEVRVEDKAAGKLAKNKFKRSRPWILDPKLKTCAREDGPQTSYPSGHTTIGFSTAVVLAHLAPEKADDIMTRAAQYGYHRMVCGMHYRSDVVAGEALGTVIGYALLQNAQFQAQFALAKAELVKAGITK